jgi:hypothetical protein
MTWKLSPHSSLWPISALEPPRAVHGTRPHKPELPSRVPRVPIPRDGKKKKKKDRDYQKPWSTALVVAATTGGQGDRNKRPRPQRGNSGSCLVHPNGRHNAKECREIIDLAKRVSERREQSSKDGSPPCRRPGKEKVDDGEVVAAERDLGYQSPEGDLKDVFARGSYSSADNKTDPRGTPCSPVYGLKFAFLRKPFRIPMGPGFRQVHTGMATTKGEGSRVKCRWGPRVGT